MLSLEEYLSPVERLTVALEEQAHENCQPFFLELEQRLGFLYSHYVDEMQYLAPDEPQSKTAELIGTGFVEVFSLLRPLGEELRAEEFSLALETCDTLKEAMESLYPLFKRYAKEYKEAPRYSEVPYTHELVRVCRHFLEGHLSRESVLVRLDQFSEYHDHLERELRSLQPSAAESSTLRANSEDLAEALKAQAEGIADLEETLLELEPVSEIVEGCLDVLTTSAEILVDIYSELQKAETRPRQIPCIRCSKENPPTAKICGSCGTVLPSGAVMSDEPASTLALEEDGTVVQTSESEEIEKLESAVTHFARTGELEPLAKAREDLASRFGRVERRLERLTEQQNSFAENQELGEMHQDFMRALGLMSQALELLSDGEDSADLSKLRAGMEQMRAAQESFESLRTASTGLAQ
jgi:predicted ribosome quality control (RQC) complex YloA/Tae2 family protein